MNQDFKFSIGSDPEVFLKKEIDGVTEYFPAIGIVEGSKEEPTPIGNKGRHILVDNVMLEFNTIPSLNVNDFVNEHLTFLNYLKKEMNKEECNISKKCYVEFHPRYLDNESAQEFGCDPDFNSYTLAENIAPTPDVNYRTAAGHIHIGYDNQSKEESIKLIKLLDLTLGVNSVIDDEDRNRRIMYGKAGAFRFKPFGFEYRVLSNYWIFNEKQLRKIYKAVERAFKLYEMGYSMDNKLQSKVINSINTYNVNEAKDIINQVNKI